MLNDLETRRVCLLCSHEHCIFVAVYDSSDMPYWQQMGVLFALNC